MKKVILSAVAAATSAVATAGPTSTVMPVTALVIESCAVVAQPLVFGQLALNAGDHDATTTINVTCTPGVSYTVGLDQGAHAAGGVRQMQGTLNGSAVPYKLFSDAARTIEWGASVGANTVAGVGGLLRTHTVYGRVPQSANLFAAGGYSDAVTVTVTF